MTVRRDTRTLLTSPLATLLGALAFGLLAGLVKGDETGMRAQVGNLSAPWLLVGFLPALQASTAWRGAARGLSATMLALLGFYASLTVVLRGHLGGGGFPAELVTELEANRVYLVAGLVTGPLMGALGAWVGRRHRLAWAILGGLLAAEAAVVALVSGHRLLPPPLYFAWGVNDWTAYLVESAIGTVVLLVLLAVAMRRRAELPGAA